MKVCVSRRLKEAAGKSSTVGTRSGREAGDSRASLRIKAKPNNHTKDNRYSQTARRERLRTLPGETSGLREREESAEAVIVRIACESRKERRAEGPRNKAKERTGQFVHRRQAMREKGSLKNLAPPAAGYRSRWNR